MYGMEEERCTLFSFTTSWVAAAVLHFMCALSGPVCLVFPVIPAVIFMLEMNPSVKLACVHTAVVALLGAALEAVPTIIWLILLAVFKGSGAVFTIITVLYIGVMVMVFLALIAVEGACGMKTLRKERAELPFITPWVMKIAQKLMGAGE
jgi:hypothetical protein